MNTVTTQRDLRLAMATYAALERRLHPRQKDHSYLSVLPLDGQGNQIGSLMIGYCNDVSEGGISMSMPQAIDAAMFRVEPVNNASSLPFKTAVFEVLRRNEADGSFTYAGRFVEKLSWS